ncbi:hypothetical protein COV20_04595 [Candidatus Woesearchaeota archaeon CG10_big_fil_rev_8_21_14_0_10_45_16]|nr:MAG: hypothetical protein COV20_04595 [Candidatus Woesearchaeota archaeon CG10_big_fil_rev_8_21_14_0_10_45_16]
MELVVKEASLPEAATVNATITEFDRVFDAPYFSQTIGSKKHLIIVAYLSGRPVGYVIGYDKFSDGSFYCWMAGVDPEHRRKGILKAMMTYFNSWVRGKGYEKIKIKTRNNRREMLSYLVKERYNFTEVEPQENIEDNRIMLEKSI